MEWLGDALLDLIVAEELYTRFPHEEEGSLSLRKQLIVRNDVLSIASQRLELTTLLLHSRERIATLDAERQRSMAERSKLDRAVNTEKRQGPNKWQADVFEALVCALYLANTDRTAQQSGFEAAARFVKAELLDAVVVRGEAGGAFEERLAERWQQEAQALTSGGVGTSWRDDKARDAATQAAQAAAAAGGGGKGKKRKHAATGALDAVAPKYAKQEAKHPKAMLQEMLHQADMGVVEYREALTADGRVAVDVYLNGQKLNATPTLGVDFKAASTAAAQEVITQLQAAQGPADPAAPPPEKPSTCGPRTRAAARATAPCRAAAAAAPTGASTRGRCCRSWCTPSPPSASCGTTSSRTPASTSPGATSSASRSAASSSRRRAAGTRRTRRPPPPRRRSSSASRASPGWSGSRRTRRR